MNTENVLGLLCQERFDELAMLKAENAKLRAVKVQLLEDIAEAMRGV